MHMNTLPMGSDSDKELGSKLKRCEFKTYSGNGWGRHRHGNLTLHASFGGRELKALLTVPRHNLERYGRRSFSCAGPTLWNALPEDLRVIANINTFKAKLKTHYFKVAFN